VAEISLLLWDVGGVLLTDGWDRAERASAVRHFQLDATEFERRHALVKSDFETDRLDWEGYLDATVFYTPRSFSREEFRDFMRAQSSPHPEAIAAARAVRAAHKYRLATLNDESRALNEYRIRTFGLAEIFDDFFTSCYTGRRKPDAAAYRGALDITQRVPAETLFLDDREENIRGAEAVGLRTLRVLDPARLREDLAHAGVATG